MTVAELMRQLAKLDPETRVVRVHRPGEPGAEGMNDIHYLMGSHEYDEEGDHHWYRPARRRFVKGQGAPDWLPASATSRAKEKVKIVLIS